MTVEVFKTWSLKIKPSVWFLRVVPLTNLRSNIHFELFLFTLIPTCLAVGLAGKYCKESSECFCLGRGLERTLGSSHCQRSSAAEKVPRSPHQRRGHNNTAAVKNSPEWKRGGGRGGVVFLWKLCMYVRPKGYDVCAILVWNLLLRISLVCCPLRSEIGYGFRDLTVKEHTRMCTAARAPVIKTCAPKKYFYKYSKYQ